jgi:dienelactone hydrolase
MLGGVALLAAATAVAAPPYLHGASFVVRAAGMEGLARRAASWDAVAVAVHDADVTWRGGTLRGRYYRPASVRGRTVLLVPGVHADGIDEPRFVGFAREIASAGHPVQTVRLDDLTRYTITPRTTDMIEDAALAVSSAAASRGQSASIGMLGISFAGGLSIVAAGRPSLGDRVSWVLAIGGHADLPRTLKYLCTGIQDDGVRRPQHDYGLAIVLYGAAHLVVPPAQVGPLREAIFSFLDASRLDLIDKAKAAAEFERAKALAAALPEPSRGYMGHVNARDVGRLGPLLLPHVAALGGDPALSPSRSAAPPAPVFLLHGTDDNVVPAIESSLLAKDLRARGVDVEVLLTPLVTHAEVDRASMMSAIWRLIDFWSDVLSE